MVTDRDTTNTRVKQNLNTETYWDARFGSGDWEAKGGFSQTRSFAESFVPRLDLLRAFAGTLCDFGCGAGDAFPVYRWAFPDARLIGVDFSGEAIRLCRHKFSSIADFIEGDHTAVPRCDIVITSNVLEHFDNFQLVVSALLEKCSRLIVVVPYREQQLCAEHVRVFDEESFSAFRVVRFDIFPSRDWSEFGLRRFVGISASNLVRHLSGRPPRRRKLQIMFDIEGLDAGLNRV